MKAQQPSHILIIDDEKSTTGLYTEWLREQYIVSEVNSGDDALTKLNDSIDIVILNCNITESGMALLQEIRDCGYDRCIIITPETEPSIDIRNLPIDEYLVKPVSRKEFVNTVERLIQLETYNDLLQRYCSLVSKLSELRTTNSTEEFAEDEQNTDLYKRIAALEADLDRITRELNKVDYHAAFRVVVE